MNTQNKDKPGIVLQEWRTRILNSVLLIVVIISLPAFVMTFLRGISTLSSLSTAISFSVIELILIVLAVFRRMNLVIRICGLVLLGYAAAIVNLMLNGLRGAGPLYLLVMPVTALILLGKRAGIVTSFLSALLATIFTVLIDRSLIVMNMQVSSPWVSLSTTLMLLTIGMFPLILFYRFQERLIDKERRSHAELLQTQELLAEQNATLEQKVQERTAELQTSNRGLEQRNAELAIINSVQEELASKLDVQAIYELIGEKVREVFDVQVVDIVTYDPTTNLISMPYSYEKGDRSVISPREPYGFRLHVINTRAPLLVNQNFVELAAQHNNPLITGEWPKSALFVPILMEGKVKGIISIQDLEWENAFDESDVRLLQTLAIAMSIAIENAYLFDELKCQQQCAEEAQRRLADIIDFLPDATLVIDHTGKVIAWNRAIEEMSGVPARDILGKDDHEYAIPFYGERRPILIDLVLLPREEIERKYVHIHRAGEILTGETYTPALKGGARYLYATASTLHDVNGTAVGAIETIRDITERKHTEEELNKAKAAAEQANLAKSAFLATMSHEIRTPMNAVIGMTSLLLDTPLNAEQRDYAETIRSSGDALLAVINDILDFSKIEAGKMDLEHQPFNLRECIETALDLVASRAVEKNLDIAYVFEGEVPTGLCGDVTRLRQVLLNLLSNAVKFTENGEVVLTVKKGRKKDELLFSVRDTGAGIPPDRMGALFQSFSQADSSTTRKYGGTGLGLAISRRLVEMMGGTIRARSDGIPGKGSTFSFTILAEPATVPNRMSKQGVDGLQATLQGKRLLIVDDNPTNRRILRLQTQKWGMNPRETGSPKQALRWLKAGERFDLAILDMHMPEMNGLELARIIRELPVGQSLPLAMLSSLGRREAPVTAAEFAAYLQKPIKPSQLFDALVSIFANAPAEETSKSLPERPRFDPQMGTRHPLRILLAEDNLVNQKVALRILEQSGYRADIASNGKETLVSVARQPYDVILMDVQMPEMDGLEATRQILARWPDQANRPHIIAMTADAMESDREMCLAAGMDDYVAKPIRVPELMNALQKVKARKPNTNV